MPPLRRLLALAAVCAVAGACKHTDTNAEFAGQGDALDTAGSEPGSEPPPQHTAATAATPPPPPPAEPPPSLTIAVCPLECHIADGPRRMPLPPQQLEALRSAFGPTMAGLRQCASVSGLEDEKHKPTINLRFGPRGDLLDVGVDPTGWDDNVEACMEQVVRGGAAPPQVSVDGPADVRCSEKCERNARWTTAPR